MTVLAGRAERPAFIWLVSVGVRSFVCMASPFSVIPCCWVSFVLHLAWGASFHTGHSFTFYEQLGVHFRIPYSFLGVTNRYNKSLLKHGAA